MPVYLSPGVYKQDIFPAQPVELPTGVPAFLGYTSRPASRNTPFALSLWHEFEASFGGPVRGGHLYHAVRGFFENGGKRCFVVALDEGVPAVVALRAGLAALEPLDEPDLIAAPDIMRRRMPGDLPPDPVETAAMQADVIAHCERRNDRFAILDALPAGDVRTQRARLRSSNAALYYPWLRVAGSWAPPSGHVAGVYARSDAGSGVHRAPANEELNGVLDVEVSITRAAQDALNPLGVNCIRALPGRGIRIWGARTLSSDPAWTYVGTRRLFLSVMRWINVTMTGVAFESSDSRLWKRVTRELTVYCTGLHERGALFGDSPEEAFYVKCDEETNSPELREQGRVVTEIGLAAAKPAEFIVVRIVHEAAGAA